METLRAEAHKENMTINHVKPLNKERLSLTFQETKDTTRSRMACFKGEIRGFNAA